MPKPSRPFRDRRIDPRRFKDWSDLADYLYLELLDERRKRDVD